MLSRIKIKFIKFKFNRIRHNKIIIKVGDNKLLITENFKYQRLFLKKNGRLIVMFYIRHK